MRNMFVLNDFKERCLISGAFKEEKSGIEYSPLEYNMLVFSCSYEFDYNETSLRKILNDLNISNHSIESLKQHFQHIGNNDVYAMYFPKEKYLMNQCFPVTERGRSYILLTCKETGTDIEVYMPVFTHRIGFCQVPLTIRVIPFIPETQRKPRFGLFRRGQVAYFEYKFEFESCEGYQNGDIFYTVEDFYEDPKRQLVIPITKKALENRHICIYDDGRMIKFGCKPKVKMI